MFDPGGSKGRLRACPFWECGARCFVGRLCVRGLDEAATFFGERMTWAVILKEGDRRIVYAKRIAANRCSSTAADLKRAMPSRTARGYQISGVNGRQEASWSGDSAERHAIWSREDPRFLDIVYIANPSFFIYYKCGMPILKGWCSSTDIR